MLAAVDATKERDLGKRFKIEGFPTGKYRRVSIRSSFNAITDIFSSLTSRLPQFRKWSERKKFLQGQGKAREFHFESRKRLKE